MAQEQPRLSLLGWLVKGVCRLQLQRQGERHGGELYPQPEGAPPTDDLRRGVQGVPRRERAVGG